MEITNAFFFNRNVNRTMHKMEIRVFIKYTLESRVNVTKSTHTICVSASSCAKGVSEYFDD